MKTFFVLINFFCYLTNHFAFRITGQWVIEKVRPDMIKKFSSFVSDDVNVIPQYIFHCNARSPT